MKIGVVGGILDRFTLEEALGICQEVGIESHELGYAAESHQGTCRLDSSEGIGHAKDMFASYGISVGAIGAWNDFVQTDPRALEQQVRHVRDAVDLAVSFGCEVVRVFGGDPKKDIPAEECPALIVHAFKECVPYAAEKGVILAMENHGRITNDAEVQLRIIEDVASSHLRLAADTSNYHWYGHPVPVVERYLREIAPLVEHTHIKDGHARKGKMSDYTALAPGEGDVPLGVLLEMLKGRGYSRPLFIEYEGAEDLRTSLAKGLTHLRALWEGMS